MDRRPDRPLVIKCTFNGSTKRITFNSARNCSYDLLRHRVEQCFSLYAATYLITYKDDDGEITDVTTDTDLTEAITYFQAGADDGPLSSAASILSGRSFGGRKITVRVAVTVDYDGPSLSDTSSVLSLGMASGSGAGEGNSYQRNGYGAGGRESEFSFGAQSELELEDDAVTVSSRDPVPRAQYRIRDVRSQGSWDVLSRGSGGSSRLPAKSSNHHQSDDTARDPFADKSKPGSTTAQDEYITSDPSAVFERLKLQEQDDEDDSSSIQSDLVNGNGRAADHFRGNDRNATWLRDQNDRAIRTMLGVLPEPSVSSGSSSVPDSWRAESEEVREQGALLGGELELERDVRGRYYYSYTSSSSSASQSRDSGYYDEARLMEDSHQLRQQPSVNNWLEAQAVRQSPSPAPSISKPPREVHNPDSPNDVPYTKESIPPELLQFLPVTALPADKLTDCSSCGVLLDSIRYVCTICGEKKPVSELNKGKGKSPLPQLQHRPLTDPDPHLHHQHPPIHHAHTYPPPMDYSYPPQPSSDPRPTPIRSLGSLSSTRSSSLNSSMESLRSHKPLPKLPDSPPHTDVPSASSSQVTLVAPEHGYELCSGCIEHAGVTHAIEAVSGSAMSGPPSEWRRLALKKGQLRHAFHEKAWGHFGWEDVDHDESQVSKCSTCSAVTTHHRYKCASCKNFHLCRACYTQVHDVHPSHAFIVIPDAPIVSPSTEVDEFESVPPDIVPQGEQSMLHRGVRCAHCMLDIVGARFHCAICDSVDICSNCESAGLPGNLDSADGGHNSSHILIKIPYPLETDEVQTASRRAIDLWQGRDAANVGLMPTASSVYSSHARTVVGSAVSRQPVAQDNDHHIACHGCGNNILGVRYQCGNCPSIPQGYSLCENCEPNSYSIHDPAHIFFKFPRPVQTPLASPQGYLPNLYKRGPGPAPGTDARAYLMNLKHTTAVCDRCMSSIQGVWFRCAYCGKDLCDACEAVDTHNDAHCFMMFKSPVDVPALKAFTPTENPLPIIPYAIYR
ncbi:unnamed protein product [Mycena citricolor]|uniref:Uncharacterized protein n=1 Tax=Mycena citricolor TaxID=2018698 RepID=A0AAD2Q2L5_9AGAR|nr:unnamed protein product [Mycena citricolor]